MANAVKNKLICTCCGGEKNERDFYISKSFIYKANSHLPICKTCLGDIFDKYYVKYQDYKLALYYMCRAVGICFNLCSFNGVLQEIENGKTTNVWQIYMTKLNSLGGKNGAGDDFDSSDNINMEEQIEILSDTLTEENKDVTYFWGEGYSNSDYEYLQTEFSKMTDRYECDSYAQETLFQDIAFQRLDIRKKRQSGSSVDKELKTLQDLLGSANIKPAQENASMASEQVTFGTLIKKYENEKPIPEPLPEWMTSDWIKKYVCVWFFGNLCRMMGKPNTFQDEYDEEVGKYTVKTDEEGEE